MNSPLMSGVFKKGDYMKAAYEHKDNMTCIGYSTIIKPNEGYEKCPQFWDKEYAQRFGKLFATGMPCNAVEEAVLKHHIGMFGLCIDGQTEFEYAIAGLYQGGEVPEGLKLFELPVGEYAIFTGKGPLPKSLQDLNDEVMEKWLPFEGKQKGAGNIMIEAYSPGNPNSEDYECGIWIPVTND